MARICCPKCAGENVKPIERCEISEFKVMALPKLMWACNNPMCMHKWSRNPNSIEINQVIGHSLDRLRDTRPSALPSSSAAQTRSHAELLYTNLRPT